jgi:predicted transcriptional regulator
METLSIPINELLEKAPSHTINELAEMYQTDYGTIYRILSRYKVSAARAYEPITKEVLEEVFEEPTTIVDAAKELNCTMATVTSAIKRHGLFGGGRKPTVKDKFNGGRAFKILGHLIAHPEENLASIGRRFNCTREYVRQIKECGIAEGIIKQEIEAYEQ